MYMELDARSSLQPYVRFDWRLVAERGLRCYGHLHANGSSKSGRSPAACELAFLLKVVLREL